MLACLGESYFSVAEAAHRDAGEADNTPDVRYHRWQATGKRGRLAEARRLLDCRVDHNPEEYRELPRRNVGSTARFWRLGRSTGSRRSWP